MKIKSLIATPSLVILIKENGESVHLSGNNLITTEEIINLTLQIEKTGFAELTKKDLSSNTLVEMLTELGIFAKEEDDGTITAKVGEAQLKNVNTIQNHITNAYDTNNRGIKNLIERMANSEFKHTAEDLLKYIELNHLPVTSDGCILGYKYLSKLNDGSLVDAHTRTIPQGVGTIVQMDKSLVDPNNERTCSKGLHVGNWEYVKCSSPIVVVKVKPEDVVSVPPTYHQDGGKMRTCSYQIIYACSAEELNSGLPDTVITNLVNGIYARAKTVVTTSANGGVLSVRDAVKEDSVSVTKSKITATRVPTKEKKGQIKEVDTKKAKTVIEVSKALSDFKKNQTITNYMALLFIKRKRKQSWLKLNIEPEDIKLLDKFHNNNREYIRGL